MLSASWDSHCGVQLMLIFLPALGPPALSRSHSSFWVPSALCVWLHYSCLFSRIWFLPLCLQCLGSSYLSFELPPRPWTGLHSVSHIWFKNNSSISISSVFLPGFSIPGYLQSHHLSSHLNKTEVTLHQQLTVCPQLCRCQVNRIPGINSISFNDTQRQWPSRLGHPDNDRSGFSSQKLEVSPWSARLAFPIGCEVNIYFPS